MCRWVGEGVEGTHHDQLAGDAMPHRRLGGLHPLLEHPGEPPRLPYEGKTHLEQHPVLEQGAVHVEVTKGQVLGAGGGQVRGIHNRQHLPAHVGDHGGVGEPVGAPGPRSEPVQATSPSN